MEVTFKDFMNPQFATRNMEDLRSGKTTQEIDGAEEILRKEACGKGLTERILQKRYCGKELAEIRDNI